MQLSEIIKKAEDLAIQYPDRYSRTDLIQTIQKAEGNFDCFGRYQGAVCGQLNCCWRLDCLKITF